MVIPGGDGAGVVQRRPRCISRELGLEIEIEVDELIVLDESEVKKRRAGKVVSEQAVVGVEKAAACVSGGGGGGDSHGGGFRQRSILVESGERTNLLLWTEVCKS